MLELLENSFQVLSTYINLFFYSQSKANLCSLQENSLKLTEDFLYAGHVCISA